MSSKYCLLLCLLLGGSVSLNAQLSFSSSQILNTGQKGSFIPLGISDINGDYRDDVVRLLGAVELQVDIQTDPEELLYSKYILNTPGGEAWTLSIGDLDNDYINDFVTAGFYNGAHIYLNTNRGLGFEKNQSTADDFYAQASNLVDINNDGSLDIFICNDDGLSKIYLNDGNGQFENSSNYIDMQTVPVSDNSGNYGSVWTDVDGDSDLDLYLSKCRVAVFDFDDPRRVNALFINENGVYVEKAADFGLDIGAQSWSADFGDIDNDGDLDCYIGNHEYRHMLMENINNDTFIEIENFAGAEINNLVYQSYFEDFDNDGLVDIIIAGEEDFILHNQGDKSFSRIDNLLGPDNVVSCTTGDLNQDGFIDVLASYYPGFNANAIPDRVYLNNGNSNNFLSVALRGTMSNSSGVGATLNLYSGVGVQKRVVNCGLSYSISKSLVQRFGLASDQTIDSLTIQWPSGQLDVYRNLTANQHLIATEGSCVVPLQTLDLDGPTSLCPGDTLRLSAQSQSNVLWNNGSNNNSIDISEEGIYQADIQDQGCYTASNSVYVKNIQNELPEVSISEDTDICAGDTLEVFSDYPGQLLWSNGDSLNSTAYFETGAVWLMTENNCGAYSTDTFNLSVIDPGIDDYYQLITDTMPLNLFADGSNVIWYSDKNLSDTIFIGNDFTTGEIDRDTIFYAVNEEEKNAQTQFGGETIDKLDPSNKYSSPLANGGMIFKVDIPLKLKTIKIETETPGRRKIIASKNGEVIFEKIIDIADEGIHEIELDFSFTETGEYVLGTDAAFNMAEIGSASCQFARLDQNVAYPYQLGDLGSIISSEWGAIYYLYFFDWSFEEIKAPCVSEAASYTIETDFTSSSLGWEFPEIHIFPNPVSNILSINSEKRMERIRVFNITGEKLFDFAPIRNNVQINASTLNCGMYLIEIEDNFRSEYYRFQKI